MAEGSAGERTEKPTAKRLAKAATDGDVLQSRELAAALVVMAGIGFLVIFGPEMMEGLGQMLVSGLRFDRNDVLNFAPGTRIANLLTEIAVPVGGVLGITFAATIIGPALLGSLGFRTSGFAFKPNKMNPLNGIKRIFGFQGLIELAKSIVKVGLLGAIGVWIIWDRLTAMMQLGKSDLEPALADLGAMFLLVCLAMGGVLMLIAGIDVPAQWIQRSRRLAMTKHEIKEEHKEQEGSPEVKGKIRQKQFAALNGSARKAVEEASVVIMNPTHFAVALRYHPGKDQAPVVVARGRGDTALAIRDLALEKGVTVLQYPELARAIYYTSRAGQFVEERLYMAVATVLAFVFRLESRMASEMDRPHINVPDDLRFDTDGRQL